MILTINNSESKIAGLTVAQFKELRGRLSYVLNPTASYYTGGYGPKAQTLLGKNGTFPTGLLYVVKDYLKSLNQTYSELDHRRVPKALEEPLIASLRLTPYTSQIDAAEAVLASGGRGIVVAPTGAGKSVICALIIAKLNVRTLVIVPNLELKRQLTESLSEIFKGRVGKGKDVYVENVGSVKYTNVYGKYDAVIIDEFHHSGAKSYRKINKKDLSSTYYRVGLTATPFRSQDNERLLLESVLSQVIYRIEHKTAVEKGFIVPVEAYFIELPKVKVIGTTWQQVYLELIVNNEKRNEIIVDILKNLDIKNRSALCLVKEIKHGNNLVILNRDLRFANGESEDTPYLIKMFSKGMLKTLVGTTGIVGEGVDTRACEYVILAGLGKAKNSLMQAFGRAFRRFEGKESAKIILFLDRSHKWTRDHYKEQCKILLEEYGTVPVKIEID